MLPDIPLPEEWTEGPPKHPGWYLLLVRYPKSQPYWIVLRQVAWDPDRPDRFVYVDNHSGSNEPNVCRPEEEVYGHALPIGTNFDTGYRVVAESHLAVLRLRGISTETNHRTD